MNINTITAEDLRRMPDKEGLILQGCGGDLTEWVDGINEMLTNAGILKDGSQFENVFAFQHGELTCLLYPFDEGNGRTQRVFLSQLARHAGYVIDFARVDPDDLMIATIQAAGGVDDFLKVLFDEMVV